MYYISKTTSYIFRRGLRYHEKPPNKHHGRKMTSSDRVQQYHLTIVGSGDGWAESLTWCLEELGRKLLLQALVLFDRVRVLWRITSAILVYQKV